MTKWGATFAAALAFSVPASARKPDIPTPICTGTVKAPLFISPMGEPFRPKPDGPDPMAAWFAAADTNHDGELTLAEMIADADRFFAILDRDHDGELLPDEVDAYEENIVPEVRLYQRRSSDGGPRREERDKDRPRDRSSRPGPRGTADYGGAIGAGRYAFLNIPNPVASADDDINRAVDRGEFRAAAAERFRALDAGQKKALTISALPRTPAQIAANAACLAAEKAKAGR